MCVCLCFTISIVAAAAVRYTHNHCVVIHLSRAPHSNVCSQGLGSAGDDEAASSLVVPAADAVIDSVTIFSDRAEVTRLVRCWTTFLCRLLATQHVV